MTGSRSTPTVVLVYGLLGLIPFLAPPLIGLFLPAWIGLAGIVLALYGGLILSFLGGARWGMAVKAAEPSPGTVSLAMLPSLVGLALLVLPPGFRALQLLGLAAALVLHWLWDLRGADLPTWYGRLRTLLTAGAVVGLVAGAVVLT